MEKPIPRIFLSPPHTGFTELLRVCEAFDSNWVAPLGPHVDAFEAEMADLIGVRDAVALSSGTAAIHLGLVGLGVKSGDEVLCSTFTFAASAYPIVYLGARPVFIDSDERSWNMDAGLLEAELIACRKRGRLPKAVVVVDLYGQCADYSRIVRICEEFEVPLLEDSAEALGASHAGRMAGAFGRLGVFSFNGNKIITASGGGMMVTDDETLASRVRHLASQARDAAPHYQHSVIGYNYRMSNVLAGIGRAQLKTLPERVAARRRNREFYEGVLASVNGVKMMPSCPGGCQNYWLTCITVDPRAFGRSREDLRVALEAANIESRPVWKPLHMQPVFAGCRSRGGAIAEDIFQHGLCLPSGSNLTADDLDRICGIVLALRRS